MVVRFQSVTFESPDPERDAEFWRGILGRPLERDSGGILLAGAGGQAGIRFALGAAHGSARNRLHLHLSDRPPGQSGTIEACVKLGGRLLGNGHVPENSYAAMADPVGDEYCVIEDGNGYLAGCGPLGEITCAGTPRVGHFWSRALGWPLVWEKGEETAIQSGAGGTKIAWSGEWATPQSGTDRQYFTVTADEQDFDHEVSRLRALGASDQANRTSAGMVLSDPDGIDFVVRAVPSGRP